MSRYFKCCIISVFRVPRTIALILLGLIFFLISISALGFKTQTDIVYDEDLYPICDFNYKLSCSSTTSAGVYSLEGELMKTLWSNIKCTAGVHKASWDGTTDDGKLVAPGKYNIHILSNNVKYKWEGVVGNSSDSSTGSTIFRALHPIQSLAASSNTIYYCTGYNEQSSSTFKFNTLDPQRTSTVLEKGISVEHVTTDSVKVFWAGEEPGSNNCFVYATTSTINGNDVEYSFKLGRPVKTKFGRVYLSAIDNSSRKNDTISGLSVQKSGRFLFVAHKNMNEIHVLDKVSGDLLKTINIVSPTTLLAVDQNFIWLTYRRNGRDIVSKFQVKADGGLTWQFDSLKHIEKPLAMALSLDNKTIMVADGGSSQQIKAFDARNGEERWRFGQEGGYTNNPQVQNDKFYFSDNRGLLGSAITIEADGSFWVEDKGNSRLQHYSKDRAFISSVMFVPMSYSVCVDENNSSRLFSDYLEFKIDYSKKLSPRNNSWSLVKNWGHSILPYQDNKYGRLRCVETLNNGRTYAIIGGGSRRSSIVVELPKVGQIRHTGIELPKEAQLYSDGSLRFKSRAINGKPFVWSKKTLVKFDDHNNPIWSNATTLAIIPNATKDDPLSREGGYVPRVAEVTSSNILISFNGAIGLGHWHLGGIKLDSEKWLWRTAEGTNINYKGDFPQDGAFDNGNSVHYAGTFALVKDRSVYWSYHGEGWKSGEVNKWNHVYDDGLFIGQFGVTGTDVLGYVAPAGMAGNVLSASVVKDKMGNTFIYHNDESIHSGIHRWKVENMESIKEEIVHVVLRSRGSGLLKEEFKGIDLNNKDLLSTNLTNSLFSTQKHNSIVSNKSARYKGFLKPRFSEEYFFETQKGNPVRLWIDNKLILDNWSGNNSGGKVNLTANINYPFELEYRGGSPEAQSTLKWSSRSQDKETIPMSLMAPTVQHIKADKINLLENLPYNKSLEDNLYGWKRIPAFDDSTDRQVQWWTVGTNIRKYARDNPPDLYMKFRQRAGNYSVTRTLDDGIQIRKFWKIWGKVNFNGTYPNSTKNSHDINGGGSSMEVLDNKEKVIVKLFHTVDYSRDRVYLYANDALLMTTTRVLANKMFKTTKKFEIAMNSGKLIINFDGHQKEIMPPKDVGGELDRPKFFRFVFWSNGSKDDRIIDIEEAFYSSKMTR